MVIRSLGELLSDSCSSVEKGCKKMNRTGKASACAKRVSSKRMKGVVCKETVVLRRWGSSIQTFGFINGVDNKHLMTGPKGNSEFCFPETLNVPLFA